MLCVSLTKWKHSSYKKIDVLTIKYTGVTEGFIVQELTSLPDSSSLQDGHIDNLAASDLASLPGNSRQIIKFQFIQSQFRYFFLDYLVPHLTLHNIKEKAMNCI